MLYVLKQHSGHSVDCKGPREGTGELVKRLWQYSELDDDGSWTRVVIQNGDKRLDLKVF